MELFSSIQRFIASEIQFAKTFFLLIKLEAKLAGLSIVPLLLTLCLLFIILLTGWLTAMVLLGVAVVVLKGSLFTALFLILTLHLALLAILIFYLKTNFKKVSFEKTREVLRGSAAQELRNKVK